MNISFREQSARFVSANQSAVTGSLLFVVAFSVFAINAAFNQPGNHPVPLWSTTQDIVTNSVTVPVRRVETTRFSVNAVPVPVLRPADTSAQHVSLQPVQLDEFVSMPPVDGKKVQSLLEQLGFYFGPIDGLIGAQTKTAIREFERSKFLPENGEISHSLVLLLESTIEASLRKSSNDRIADASTGSKKDSNAAMVTRIQVGLINYGINDVSIDGVMGKQTSQAIKIFQQKFKLEVNGLASDTLVKKLENIGALTKG